MDERQRKLFELFKIAIGRERGAQEMYTEMLAMCDDDEMRKVIEAFQRQEEAHERYLTEHYAVMRSMVDSG
jgi:rubrerythrin